MEYLLWQMNLVIFGAFPAHNQSTDFVNHCSKITGLEEPSPFSICYTFPTYKKKVSVKIYFYAWTVFAGSSYQFK